MYIDPFLAGFVLGAITATAVIIVAAVIYGKKGKK